MTDIHIRPDEVRSAGGLIDDKAEEARTRMVNVYDSAEPARDGNRGFLTGPALVAYCDAMRAESLDSVQRLQETGRKIVAAAQNIERTDDRSAESISRVATALDGSGG